MSLDDGLFVLFTKYWYGWNGQILIHNESGFRIVHCLNGFLDFSIAWAINCVCQVTPIFNAFKWNELDMPIAKFRIKNIPIETLFIEFGLIGFPR